MCYKDISLTMEDRTCVKRTTTEKVLCVLFVAILCVTIVLAGIIIFFATKYEKQDVCLTAACARAAANVLNSVDFSVNPCDNFYEFACGRWMQRNIVPEDKSYHATFTALRDEVQILIKGLLESNNTSEDTESISKAKALYQSCINTDIIERRNISVLFPVLGELGGWPMLGNSTGGNWSPESYNLNNLLGRLMKYYNSPLMLMNVFKDYKLPNRTVIYIDQPNLMLPSRDYYLKSKDDEILRVYKSIIQTFSYMIGASAADVEKDVPGLLEFEIELAKILSPPENRRDNEKRYNLFKLKDLDRTFGVSVKHGFSLQGYAKNVFAMPDVNITLKDDDEIFIIQDMNFTSKLMHFLDQYSPRTVTNYVILRFLRNRVANLPKRFTNLLLDMSKMIEGKSVSLPRWQECSSIVVDYMGLSIGQLFVKNYFAPDAKVGMTKMIKYIKEAFNDILHENEWMDAETNIVAQEKIAAMEEKIGYDDDILNNTLVNRRYENMTVRSDLYFENILGLLHTSVKENLLSLKSYIYRLNWETTPSTVNAYYSSIENRIMFPAGILQQPYFHKDQPWSLNFGGIGTLVGHEITHGFDDRGRQFDKHGRLNQWWNEDAIKRFNIRSQCFVDQYGNFLLPEAGGKPLNGLITLGENIADNGGIKQSFKGYKKWQQEHGKDEPVLPGVNLTHEQLFFVAFAQIRCANLRKEDAISSLLTGVHSPSRFRVIGTLQNYGEFSRVFQCPVGSYMNPVNKCSVW